MRILIVFSCLALLAASGCQTMTPAQSAQKRREAVERERAEQAKKENQGAVQKLDAKDEELKRKAQAVQAQIQREKELNAAIALIQAGNAQGALEITNKLLEQAAAAELAKNAPPAPQQPGPDGVLPPAPPPPPPPMSPVEQARVQLVHANALIDLNDEDQAIACFKKAHELDPSNRSARINLGKLYFKRRQYRPALDAWSEEFKEGYRSGELLFYSGQCYYSLALEEKKKKAAGEASLEDAYIEAARLAVQQAFLDDPANPDKMKWMAILEFETGRNEEALRLLKRLLTASPMNPEYLELIANCHVRRQDYKSAVSAFEQVARVKEPSKALCISLSDLYGQIGVHERAADWMLRAYGDGMAKAAIEDRMALAGYLASAERNDEAVTWLKTVAKTERQYPDARALSGRVLLKLGKEVEALEALEEASELRPQDGMLLLQIGDIYRAKGELDKAEAAYSKTSSLPGFEADGHAGLGEIMYDRKDLRRAVQCYMRAEAAAPEERHYRTIREQLEIELKMTGM